MGKIIAITNQKGGVGKTTTCINLSAYIAAMGKSVLIVDIDPQGNASSGLGLRKNKLEYNVYDALINEIDPSEIIVKTGVDRLDILPSNIDLAGAEVDLVYIAQREKRLKSILTLLKNNYDYIMIDCPPSLGLLTINALTACDSAFIPIPGEFFALEGLSQLLNTIKLVKKHLNPVIDVEGVVLTMFDGRSNLVNSVAEEVHKFFGKKVYDTKIPRNVRLGEAPSYGLPVMHFDPNCTGAVGYRNLAEEFLTRNNDPFEKLTKESLKRRPLPKATDEEE